MEYKIEKNVFLDNYGDVGRPEKYPFDEMEVGDSFFIKIGDEFKDLRSIRNSLTSCINNYYRKHYMDDKKRKFSLRTSKEKDGVRIWRII